MARQKTARTTTTTATTTTTTTTLPAGQALATPITVPDNIDPALASLMPTGGVIASLASPEQIEAVSQLSDVETRFALRFNVALSDAPEPVLQVNRSMLRYISLMNPNAQVLSSKEGADNQMILFNAFMRALSLTGDAMFMAVELILLYINDSRTTTFSNDMVYRYVQNIQRGVEETTTYLKILEIFLLICDPTTRNQMVVGGRIREAVGLIDPRYVAASAALVTYLSQYH